ncbi:MAG TPA: hypothetical protein VEX13_15145 [Chloroflexia bacterium]|nr:hypothetical protein [Chloroflexia bacterium]
MASDPDGDSGNPWANVLYDEMGLPVESPADVSNAISELANRGLKPSSFVSAVMHEVKRLTKTDSRQLNCNTRYRLAKFWYGRDDSIHYELWVHERTSQLELGLHFEAAPATNQKLYKRFDRCMLEIQARLGGSVWLEEWDKGWVRLYETQPLWPLDDARVASAAERLYEMLSVLQPMCDAFLSDLDAMPPAPVEARANATK